MRRVPRHQQWWRGASRLRQPLRDLTMEAERVRKTITYVLLALVTLPFLWWLGREMIDAFVTSVIH